MCAPDRVHGRKKLLKQYKNTMTLIHATYKTTSYGLALFFICVRINVDYSVVHVAPFVVQSKNKDNTHIEEALKVLCTILYIRLL